MVSLVAAASYTASSLEVVSKPALGRFRGDNPLTAWGVDATEAAGDRRPVGDDRAAAAETQAEAEGRSAPGR